jgi:predicted transcriptional regulator|tara:strand:- start:16805 stop:17383 length:579 start_codon:yes stop_codon:yes gene_type:complete
MGIIGIPVAGIQGVLKGSPEHEWGHPLRNRIMITLDRSPGIHFRELQRRLVVANGTLRHRLRRMESEGDIFVQRTNGRVCYYAGPPAQLEILNGIRITSDARASSILPVGLSDLQRKIVSRLVERDSFRSQADLARSLGRSRSAVNSAVMVLRNRGIIQEDMIKLESHLSCLSNPTVDYGWVDMQTRVGFRG